MAKANEENLNNTEGENQEEAVKSGGKKRNSTKASKNNAAVPAPQEESHGGLIAAIIAFVALLFIGGGILAFVLLVKAKNKYIDPLAKNPADLAATLVPGDGLGTGDTVPNPPGVGVGSTGADGTTPAPPITVPSSPTTPPENPPLPPLNPGNETSQDTRVPVDHYDFGSQVSIMDNNIEAVSPNSLNSDQLDDSEVGFGD